MAVKIFVVDKAEEYIQSLKAEIKRIEDFVELAENYQADTFEKKVIKEYAYIGSVTNVAKKMNDLGHRIDGRKLDSNDISAIIKSKPIDDLHRIVRDSFNNQKKRVNKRYN